MISIAVTTYNRSGFVAESFINVLDNEYISEIVIVDDCSPMPTYNNLKKLIMRLGHVKIRLYRNKSNLGGFLNKIKAVNLCHNDWVVLLDSDNVIDNDYIDIIKDIDKHPNTLYSPCCLLNTDLSKKQWSYEELTDIPFDRYNVCNYINNTNFGTMLNTGNNFFNRGFFLEAVDLRDIQPEEIIAGDSVYLSYLWLLNNGIIKVVQGLKYAHRIHDGSYYINTIEESMKSVNRTYQKIRELNPPAGGFIVNKEFDLMIARSYDYNKEVFQSDPKWHILEELYNKNFLHYEGNRWESVIPRKIHQIWIGGEIPERFRVLADTWKKINPQWEYKLWTDADIEKLNMPNRDLYYSLTNPGPKSDLLRYFLLNEYGGVYADTDFECLRPFDPFLYLKFFTGVGYPSKVELYPGLIGCVPHHPIIEETTREVWKIKTLPTTPHQVLETTSCYFFTDIFWKVISGYTEDIVCFPPDYFYPFPNQRGHEKRNGRVYIKDCSYALHHWAVSWLNK